MSVFDETWKSVRLQIVNFQDGSEINRAATIEDRDRLAAAAPELYRALKRIEFVDDNDDDRCPACGGLKPGGRRSNWYAVDAPAAGHRDGCALAAALAKAEGR